GGFASAIDRLSRHGRLWRGADLHRKQFRLLGSWQTNDEPGEWAFSGGQPWPITADGVQRADVVGPAQRAGHGKQQQFFVVWLAALRRLRHHGLGRSARSGGPVSQLLRRQDAAVFCASW